MVIFTNVTNAIDANVIVSEQDYILMTIQACSDVVVYLTPTPRDFTAAYEIHIGISGNSRTEIHRVGENPQ